MTSSNHNSQSTFPRDIHDFGSLFAMNPSPTTAEQQNKSSKKKQSLSHARRNSTKSTASATNSEPGRSVSVKSDAPHKPKSHDQTNTQQQTSPSPAEAAAPRVSNPSRDSDRSAEPQIRRAGGGRRDKSKLQIVSEEQSLLDQSGSNLDVQLEKRVSYEKGPSSKAEKKKNKKNVDNEHHHEEDNRAVDESSAESTRSDLSIVKETKKKKNKRNKNKKDKSKREDQPTHSTKADKQEENDPGPTTGIQSFSIKRADPDGGRPIGASIETVGIGNGDTQTIWPNTEKEDNEKKTKKELKKEIKKELKEMKHSKKEKKKEGQKSKGLPPPDAGQTDHKLENFPVLPSETDEKSASSVSSIASDDTSDESEQAESDEDQRPRKPVASQQSKEVRIKFDLNLEVEVVLRAKIKGEIMVTFM
ncbi:hypothetical protein FQN57_001521 [Myotisia sp. PD_48]|nr:hypothetical protein FQN57_001521 [Myotisia sp. PD_48]